MKLNQMQEPRSDLSDLKGRERILLVDDNQDVLHVTQRVLESLGYQVTALSGQQRGAWCVFKPENRF